MKETLQKGKKMDSVNIYGRISQRMRVTLSQAKLKEKVRFIGLYLHPQ